MVIKHLFKAALNWEVKSEEAYATQPRSLKSHGVSIEGKPDLEISAAKAFKGDPALHNPEDLLLSSLMSCHMMSYLYCCTKNNIDVVAYSDQAEAVLEVSPNGSGRLVKVILNPVVTISNPGMKALAIALHQEANQLCFIANSCNFPVEHNPRIVE